MKIRRTIRAAACLAALFVPALALAQTYPSPTLQNLTLQGNLAIGGVTQNFPASGNIVGTTDVQTLSNKTISGLTLSASGGLQLSATGLTVDASGNLVAPKVYAGSAGGPTSATLVVHVATNENMLVTDNSGTIQETIADDAVSTFKPLSIVAGSILLDPVGGNLVLSALAGGGTQCLYVDNSGIVHGSGAACGAGGGGLTIGTTAIASGTSGCVLYDSSGVLQCDGGFTYAANGKATLGLGTITANAVALNITATFNAAGVTFDAPFFENVTTTAFHSGSYLVDIQNNGATVFAINAIGTPSLSQRYPWMEFGVGLGAANSEMDVLTANFGANVVSGVMWTMSGAGVGVIGSNNAGAGNNGIWTCSSCRLGFSNWNVNAQALWISPATATIQQGDTDAAAPVAQTYQVQNVVAGTSNTNGVNFTIAGSRSTGTGISGDIIFQTGGTGAGATSQNSLLTALTIKGATQLVKFGTAGFTANGTVATAMSSLGPTGSHTTIQEWLTVQDSSGNTRYIPAF